MAASRQRPQARLPPSDLADRELYRSDDHPHDRRDPTMGTQENKQAAQDAYAAFSSGDAEGAMRNIDDSIEWTVRGDNALTGTYNGKQAVGELWGKFMSKDFRTEPHDFVAEGDKVVVLTTVHLDGDSIEDADVLTYNGAGKLVAFDTLADEAVPNRVFAK
jgi:uncharacterized protein